MSQCAFKNSASIFIWSRMVFCCLPEKLRMSWLFLLKMMFQSFKMSVFDASASLFILPTKLPLRSQVELTEILSPLTYYIVFSISRRWIGSTSSSLTVKIPKIRARKDYLLSFKCFSQSLNIFLKVLSSPSFIVLMINLESWEKKKKLPLFP